MKVKRIITYLTLITCCFYAACSQTPSKSENNIGKVTGTVYFDDNVPHINNFEVRAYAYSSQQWHDTKPINSAGISSDGSYSMKLPKGTYIFTLFNVQQNGPEFYYKFQHQFPSTTYELRLLVEDTYSDSIIYANQFFSCEPEAMSVPNDGALPGIDFDIQDTGMILGNLSQSNGTPFTQVTIKAYACKDRNDEKLIETLGPYETSLSAVSRPDALGNYTICCLPIGDYFLMAEADQKEFITLYTQYKDDPNTKPEDRIEYVYHINQATPKNIDLGNSWRVNFRMKQGTTITGHIQSEDKPNEPIKKVYVSALMNSTNYEVGKSILSDSDGNYTIYGLPEMSYILYVDADITDYQSCFYNTKYNSADADVFKIENTNPIIKNFDLQKQGRIVAPIIDMETDEIITDNQIYVKFYRSSDLVLIKTVQSDNGIIETGLDEGIYKAEVITDGTSYASIYYYNATSFQNAVNIDITTGSTKTTVEFKLQRGGSIKGNIDYENCYEQDHNFTVIAYSEKNPTRIFQSEVQSNGDYEIDGLPSGNDYIVKVQTENTAYISEYYDQSYFQNTATSINVEYDQVTPKINFNLECGRQIFGKVTDDIENTSISGILIKATCLDNNLTYTTTTDSTGNYVISGIPSGYEFTNPSPFEYTISADTLNNAYISESYSSFFQFSRNETQREINFRLDKLAKICGTIICPSNRKHDYCIENILPGDYDLVLLNEENDQTLIKEDIELKSNEEMTIDDIDL
jgi:hypothetical protein